MSTKHVELPTLQTGLIRSKKLPCRTSLLERRSINVLEANQDIRNEIEVIMRAAADLDDHDH
jgi:hypothetical protein